MTVAGCHAGPSQGEGWRSRSFRPRRPPTDTNQRSRPLAPAIARNPRPSRAPPSSRSRDLDTVLLGALGSELASAKLRWRYQPGITGRNNPVFSLYKVPRLCSSSTMLLAHHLEHGRTARMITGGTRNDHGCHMPARNLGECCRMPKTAPQQRLQNQGARGTRDPPCTDRSCPTLRSSLSRQEAHRLFPEPLTPLPPATVTPTEPPASSAQSSLVSGRQEAPRFRPLEFPRLENRDAPSPWRLHRPRSLLHSRARPGELSSLAIGSVQRVCSGGGGAWWNTLRSTSTLGPCSPGWWQPRLGWSAGGS